MSNFVSTLASAVVSTSEIGFTGTKSTGNLFTNILSFVYLWGTILAVIVIIVAGIMYVVSQGEASKVTRAKNAILGAVVGLIIILIAFTITNIILRLF